MEEGVHGVFSESKGRKNAARARTTEVAAVFCYVLT